MISCQQRMGVTRGLAQPVSKLCYALYYCYYCNRVLVCLRSESEPSELEFGETLLVLDAVTSGIPAGLFTLITPFDLAYHNSISHTPNRVRH